MLKRLNQLSDCGAFCRVLDFLQEIDISAKSRQLFYRQILDCRQKYIAKFLQDQLVQMEKV